MIRFKLKCLTSIIFFVLFLTGSIGKAQQIQVFTSQDSVAIGDIISYTLVLPAGLSYESIQVPDSTSFGANFEYLSKKQFKTSTSQDSIEYRLQFFGTENVEIKGLFVTLMNADSATPIAIPDITLAFKTMLAGQGEEELRPLKDIYDFKINWIPYLLLLIILIISAWVIARYITKYRDSLRNKVPEEVQSFKNPLDHLEISLLALRSDESFIQRDFKSFYTKLGDLLRDYVEIVHSIGALEMTSRELIREMEQAKIDDDLTRQINIVLRRADMVKFAKLEPSVDDALESVRDAERFVQIARQTDMKRVLKLKADFELEKKENLKSHEQHNPADDENTQEQSNDLKRNDA